MLGFFHAAGSVLGANASAPLLGALPLTVLILCIVAGVGTVLVLPARRKASVRKIGGLLSLLAGLIGLVLLIRYAARLPGETTTTGVYFWIFAVLAIFGAFRVVTHPRPVYSALYFVLAVMASAGLFVLLRAEFMAAALVIIYAGAILVTYLFVIMLAAQTMATDKPLAGLAEYDIVSREPILASAIGFLLMAVLIVLIFDQSQAVPVPVGPDSPPAPGGLIVEGSTQSLGQYLFNHQLLSLELAGLMLTMAMVGSIVIARRRVVDAVVVTEEPTMELAPFTPASDDPHSIPVDGSFNPRQKAYPES